MIKRATKLLLLVTCLSSSAYGQELPALPTLTMPTKGDTINLVVTGGTKSSLNFGSSTSMGVNVNLTASEGTSVSVSSKLAPSAGSSVLFSIGTGEEPGKTTANIENIRTQGSGETTIGNSTIESAGTNANGSSGIAELTGVQATLDYKFDPSRTEFSATAGTIAPRSELETIQTPTESGSKAANGGGGANLNTSTNVDINSSTFTSVFMQAF